MGLIFDYIIGKTVTINDQTVRIDKFIGRGASCVTYGCTLIKNGTPGRKMLLKEFLPIYAGFPINEVLTDDSLEHNNNEIVGRYLPALSKEFEDAYNKFCDAIKRIDALIDEVLVSGTEYRRYIVPLPDSYHRKFNIDKEHHFYNAFMLFDYESLDIEKTIGRYSFIQRIKIVEVLCKVVAKFHSLNLLFCDLKPSNFIYDFDDVLPILKLFDFDSIVVFNNGQIKEKEVFGTAFFSAPEVMQNNISRVKYTADIYSLGAILLYFAIYNQINEYDLSLYKPKNFIRDYYMQQLIVREGCTQGFCNKFLEIVKESTNPTPNHRINSKSNMQPALQLADEIHELIEIYENKGIHPELMFDYAKKQSDEFSKATIIDEELLADILEK